MYRRVIALELGGYNYERSHGKDYDLWLRLGTRGRLAILPFYAVAYNTRPGNISSKHLAAQLQNSIHIISKYKNDYNNYYYSILIRYIELIIYGIMGISPYSPYKLRIINIIRKITANIENKSSCNKHN
jgi:hypothetical protein